MNPAADHAHWAVRHPWPDEMERLPPRLHEPLGRPGARRHWLWVLVAGELERVVGAITLAERDPSTPSATTPDGRIDYTIAAGWRSAVEPVHALFDAALAQADALGLAPLEAQTEPDTAASRHLAAHGFVTVRRTEVWRVPLAANFARRHAAVERGLARRPVPVRALDEAALPAVRRICAAHGLLTGRQVVLAREPHDGLDPALSFVAGPPEAPHAVLLARRLGGQPYLEVLARNPDTPAGGPEVGALLHAFFSAARKLGADHALCVVDPDRNPDSLRLITRNQAEKVERIAVLRRQAP